ncbi:hypothetical protein T552_01248 [Pneumocystis carinii B80]|uniref:DUF726-domain-containing protein n=1 Tax=Pneumocystis carinii (strain B80) TaxID=1408658 RepID=A0A0W4ZLN7_PNEC8|nr:hypothetical protein T552_01248 [Pneumocystis carinii B80]KTW29293.1 hypothetical protein T552_01248 [Pneumocystis carinii B80]
MGDSIEEDKAAFFREKKRENLNKNEEIIKNKEIPLNKYNTNIKETNEEDREGMEEGKMLDMSKEVETDVIIGTQSSFLEKSNDICESYKKFENEFTDVWKTMEYVISDDEITENNNSNSKTSEDNEWQKINTRGYTKLSLDEDSLSDMSLNEKTSYLFSQENFRNDETTIPLQMEFIKDLLTEEQRIAYVSLCRLIFVEMIGEISLSLQKGNGNTLVNAVQSMEFWGQKILTRLYSHMDISSDEQVMIEQLSKHGIETSDIASVLMTTIQINNSIINVSENYDNLNDDKSPFFISKVDADENKSHVDDEKALKLDIRWAILCDLFLVLVADSIYDSRSRFFLERVGKAISISALDITIFEKKITDELIIQENFEASKNDQNILKLREKSSRNKRYMLMGLATISGGLIIGLSSGILAPLIGAGLGAAFSTIGVAGTTGFLVGTGGTALITTGGVVTGSSIAVKKMSNRVKSIKVFEFKPLYDNKRLNLLITVPGWMLKDDDVRLPFSTIDPIMGDVYSILWEPEILQSVGKTINIIATEILTQSLQQVLGQTVLVTLMSALQWPLILTKLGYLIDNPFVTSLQRAKSAGLVLADILLHRKLGARPISLVGFSLGSRVIYYCLLELAKKHAYGIIQDVYLFGTPVVIKENNWILASSVVAGRFINGYIKNDWILGYLFRITYGGIGHIAGLQSIQKISTIENIDVSDLVDGHMNYREAMPKLMKKVGWLIESEEFQEIEVPDPDKYRERQKELLESIEKAKKDPKKSEKTTKNSYLKKFNLFEKKQKNINYNSDNDKPISFNSLNCSSNACDLFSSNIKEM